MCCYAEKNILAIYVKNYIKPLTQNSPIGHYLSEILAELCKDTDI